MDNVHPDSLFTIPWRSLWETSLRTDSTIGCWEQRRAWCNPTTKGPVRHATLRPMHLSLNTIPADHRLWMWTVLPHIRDVALWNESKPRYISSRSCGQAYANNTTQHNGTFARNIAICDLGMTEKGNAGSGMCEILTTAHVMNDSVKNEYCMRAYRVGECSVA